MILDLTDDEKAALIELLRAQTKNTRWLADAAHRGVAGDPSEARAGAATAEPPSGAEAERGAGEKAR
jgi:hypothetical protein